MPNHQSQIVGPHRINKPSSRSSSPIGTRAVRSTYHHCACNFGHLLTHSLFPRLEFTTLPRLIPLSNSLSLSVSLSLSLSPFALSRSHSLPLSLSLSVSFSLSLSLSLFLALSLSLSRSLSLALFLPLSIFLSLSPISLYIDGHKPTTTLKIGASSS